MVEGSHFGTGGRAKKRPDQQGAWALGRWNGGTGSGYASALLDPRGKRPPGSLRVYELAPNGFRSHM